jgi:hypothetical protein
MDGEFRYYTKDKGSGTVEFEVEIAEGIYPITTCVVDGDLFLQGQRIFPCGSGDDHRLTDAQAKTVRNLLTANMPAEKRG